MAAKIKEIPAVEEVIVSAPIDAPAVEPKIEEAPLFVDLIKGEAKTRIEAHMVSYMVNHNGWKVA